MHRGMEKQGKCGKDRQTGTERVGPRQLIVENKCECWWLNSSLQMCLSFKWSPPTFVSYYQKTMMQVKATPTFCRMQIGCQWVGVFVVTFHMTLIIHWKVKGKGIMNFKCQQEDQCSKDKLVSFLGSKLSLSSLDILLLAVRRPLCLYQHLATIPLAHTHLNTHTGTHTHTHTQTHLQWWV